MLNKERLADELTALFSQAGKPLRLNEIAIALGIRSETAHYETFKTLLKELCKDNIIIKYTRRQYFLPDYESLSTYEGIFKILNNKGIVETDNPTLPIISIKRRNFHTALDCDRVKVRLLAVRQGKKPRGEIIEVVQRNQSEIIGTVDHDGSFYFLIPDEEKYCVDFLIPKDKLKGAKQGEKVSADFLFWNDPLKSPTVAVKEIIGKAGDPKVEFEGLIKELNLPKDFPENVRAEEKEIQVKLNRVQHDIIQKENARLDLRDKEIITIDPEDAKDFDDALSLEILTNGNYRLGVHIADVSHYVKENSGIDIEARRRGTSIYLADRAIPMLPEALCNDVCSLKPNEDRLTKSVFMEYSKRGILKKYEIHKTIIRSKRRFTYNEVRAIIETGSGEFSELILRLHELAGILRKRRFEKGGIDFETFEVKFKLDKKHFPVEAILKESNEATKLVEECMLAANQVIAAHIRTIARKLKVKALPFIYRIHDLPEDKVIKDTLQFIRTLGIGTTQRQSSSKDINNMLHRIKNESEKYIIHQLLIRSMAKAIYSTVNIGHFGLGFDEYTHFTSPIRRYPDLIVHRLIEDYSKNSISEEKTKVLKIILKDIAKHCSERERLAIEAERESIKLAGSMMASKWIGEDFDGTISGVTTFGLFVLLDKIYCEGLLHIKELEEDYYYYDNKNFCIIGKRTKALFRMGKRLRVKIINANVEKRKVDLKLVKILEEKKA